MDNNNDQVQEDQQLEVKYKDEEEEQPKKKPVKGSDHRRKNMEKARKARLEKLRESRKQKALQYDVEDEEEQQSEDEEVDEDLLRAMLEAKSKGKKKTVAAAEPDEKVINRIDRLEDVMVKFMEYSKKERAKTKRQADRRQPANTKIVLLPPTQTGAGNKKDNSDLILDLLRQGKM
jgi:hypothetical protein